MQIGNPELDEVCRKAILPALKACGFLEPKRVDKHNKGGLLKSEIVKFIEGADIIVADLTNERPNCYLEVGYAMGLNKFRNLILTAREDHNHDSPNHRPGGPKIHFDLEGYDVLFWNPEHPEGFQAELSKRIRRRQAIISTANNASPWDMEWINQQREVARAGLQKAGLKGFMEVVFALSDLKPNAIQRELLEAASQAEIRKFGWPIGIVFQNRDEFRPRPRADGIVAEIVSDHPSYDYWALRKDGDFYLLKSLFEDKREPRYIFFNTRIVRVTEALLYCARLYLRLGVPSTAVVNISIRHGGLKGRTLTASSPSRSLDYDRTTSEDEVYSDEISVPLSGIESDLVSLVKRAVQPLFMVFDFFELDDTVYEDIVNKFVEGQVT